MRRNQKPINTKAIAQKAVIIARVSSREQEKGVSIDAQVEKIRNYCTQKGLNNIKEFIITEASTKLERKKFYAMLDFVKKQPGKIVIVADCVDRMQRSFREHPILDSMRMTDKIEMHFVRDGQIIKQDSNSSEKLFWNMSVLVAQNYTDSSSDNIKRSLEQMWKVGRYSSWSPIGYLNQRDKSGLSEIVIDPENAPKVKKLFEAYNSGLSLNALEKFTQDIDLLSRYNNPLRKSTIHFILTNPFYYGMMVIKGQLLPHIHGNIITKELFDSVQERLVGKCNCNVPKYKDEPFILRNLIKCSCGSKMTPEKHTKNSGRQYTYMKCSHYHKDCKQKPVNENTIIKQLNEQVFDKLYIPPCTLSNLKTLVAEEIKQEYKDDIIRREQTEKAISDIVYKKKRLLELLVKKTITDEEYNSQKSEYELKELELKGKLLKHSYIDDNANEIANCIFDFAANARELWNSSKQEEKRQLLEILVANSQIKDSSTCFYLKKPFDTMVKTANLTKWRRVQDSNLCIVIHDDGLAIRCITTLPTLHLWYGDIFS